jgi:hypothetical protein
LFIRSWRLRADRGVLLWLNASRGLLISASGRFLPWSRRETVDL